MNLFIVSHMRQKSIEKPLPAFPDEEFDRLLIHIPNMNSVLNV